MFGEIGLLLGEPRHATVTALTDVLCYRLDKAAFEDILHRRPEIANDISHLLAEERKGAELDAAAEGPQRRSQAVSA